MTIAVLGAGALGLSAALRLGVGGDRVTAIERESQPGGAGRWLRGRAWRLA